MEGFYELHENHTQGLNHKFQDKFSIRQALYDDIILVFWDGLGVSADWIAPMEACNCNDTCSTNQCRCQEATIECSTKCHSSKTKSCSNI